MKKYILYSVIIVAVAAVAAWNVSLNSQSNDLSELSLTNKEALAGENENNHWTDWFSQGLTKDEYVRNVKCKKTTGWSINLVFWSYDNQTEYEVRKNICCEPGYANCTPTDCQ